MSGLFELQLPNESRSRRSHDVSRPRPSSSRGGSGSPPPEVVAREIVNQVVAKQQAANAAAANSTSIFPWRRRPTAPDPSRQSSDASSRNSTEASQRGVSQSPDRQRKYSDRVSPRRPSTAHTQPAPTSPRASTSIEFKTTPLSPDPGSSQNPQKPEHKQPRAASALAHAGLGLGLPPISFPGPSSPVSRTNSQQKKPSNRPGSVHRDGPGSTSNASLKVENVRRVKSFSRNGGAQSDGEHHRSTTKEADNGDVFVFSHDHPAPHVRSMPEWSSQDANSKGKGKGKERVFGAEPTPVLGNNRTVRGRQVTSPPTLVVGDRDRSATRRTSWWPGRRRVDSTPGITQPFLPSSSPPPIPQRSQARPSSRSGAPTPSLPSFRPFSPLMSEFQLTDSPGPTTISFEDRHLPSPRRLDDTVLSFVDEEGAPIRRRHSLNNRTGGTHSYFPPVSSHASGHSPSQIHPRSHRHSQSLTASPEQSTILSSMPNPPSIPSLSPSNDLSTPMRLHSEGQSTITATRRRSLTVNSPPLSPPLSPSRETPLLLRHPVGRPNSSAGPPDPFLTGWGAGTGTRLSAEVPDTNAFSTETVDGRRTPSTSSGSTSSLSHAASASRSPRQRAGTTPPTSRAITASSTSISLPPPSSSNRLLRRISSTLFNTTSAPVSPPVDALPSLNSTANLSSFLHSGAGTSSPATSDASSPHWSRENLSVGDGARSSAEVLKHKLPVKPLTRTSDETPWTYLNRLIEAVSKAEVAHVLAASGDLFHAQALRSYIDRFNFLNDPIDVALRKLLMDLGLPRETQQIDRVMEAFAARYVSCNPGLFTDDDQPYILAFSLIMLHTDAFNKSNRNKMTKVDYVKNTRLPGVPSEILECFFDNIVFAPFIFIEDPMDANAPKGYLPEGTSRLSSINVPASGSGVAGNLGGSAILGKANKIDPYYLITQDLLGPLRADVYVHIPRSNPFLYEGTDWPWDTRRLHLLFALAQVIQVGGDAGSSALAHNATGNTSVTSTPARRKSIALPSLAVGYGPFMGSPPFSSDGLPPTPPLPAVTTSRGQGTWTLKITKAGVLARKEDTTEGGKRSTNRKWREWSVVLTGSQLLFFRDASLASQLTGQNHMAALGTALLNPDEVLSLHECLAVFDRTYTKYTHTFRLSLPNDRQFLIQAPDEKNLNEWIAMINYASAFKTAGVQMRGLGMRDEDVEMTGVAAAASHLEDLRVPSKMSTPTLVHTYGSAGRTLDVPPLRPQSSSSSPRIGSGSKLLRSFNGAPKQVDLEVMVPPQVQGAQQFKATFDEVKAELAAHGAERSQPSPSGRVRTLSMGSRPNSKPPGPGGAAASSRSEDMQHSTHTTLRSDIVQTRVDSLESKIACAQSALDSELRIAHNLAILTPFQRATRDRVQFAVVTLAKKVRTMRLELTKLTCHRFVLLTDLADEERQWEQVKRDALKAATQRLSAAEEPGFPQSEERFDAMPHPVAEPSTSESFYSALEGDHAGSLSTPLSMLSEDDDTDFPFPPHIRTGTSRDSNVTPTSNPPVTNGHERYYTAAETPEEIAEEWNETRAAKRVSLIKLPSEVKLSAIRHARSSRGGEASSSSPTQSLPSVVGNAPVRR